MLNRIKVAFSSLSLTQKISLGIIFLSLLLLPVVTLASLRQARLRSRAAFPATPPVTPPIPPTPTPAATSSASRVFVTSTTYNGDLGGLTGADAKCQERANAANLGGAWKAWLSDIFTSASSRFVHNPGPYKLVNGTLVANDWNDLIDGNLQNPINITELNGSPAWILTWTNTKIDGGILSIDYNQACNNFSSLDYLRKAVGTGYAGVTDGRWTNNVNNSPYGCDGPGALYCFEQLLTPVPSPTPTPPTLLPDLTVNSLSVSPQFPRQYQNVEVKAEVANTGRGDVKSLSTAALYTRPRGRIEPPQDTLKPEAWLKVGKIEIGRLRSGETQSASFLLTPQTGGDHFLKVAADINDEIKEENETNNEKVQAVSIESVIPSSPIPY